MYRQQYVGHVPDLGTAPCGGTVNTYRVKTKKT